MKQTIKIIVVMLAFSLLLPIVSSAQANDACFGNGCHSDVGTSYYINNTQYDANSHDLLECIDCHTSSINPLETEHGEFLRTLDGTNLTGPLSFTQYSSSNYQLCYYCHNETKLIGLPSGYSNNLWTHRPTSGYPLNINELSTNFANELSEGYNFDNYPANIHWDHLDMYGINNNQMWDSNRDGILDSMTSCTACHDPHGNSNGPALTHDDLGIEFGTDANGNYGTLSNLDYLNQGGDVYCYGCHGSNSNFKYYRTPKNLMSECTSCHTGEIANINIVTSVDLGLHSSLNSTSDVDDGDCGACHFDNPHSGPDATNTYYCADCHTSAGTSPIKSTIEFVDKLHGENTCTDCHVADGTYHQNDPRGSVANSIYVDRDVTGSTTVTDCADCHYASNLDDAPFNAPAGGSHILSNGGACAGSCHTSGITTMIQTVHNVGVGPDWGDTKPSISVPILDTAYVSSGIDVTVTATVTAAGQFHNVDGAQYRIMNGSTEVIPWMPMTAVDGDYEGVSEDVTITLDTSLLPLGIYAVEVRGMAAGPAQISTERYYPMNGDVSSTESATLTVQQPSGYINGTVVSGVSNLSGVLVSTTGATDTTGPDGTYSLMVPAGTYAVTASRLPEYNDGTVSGVVVVVAGETIRDFNLVIKPIGLISGNVVNHV